MAKPENWDRMTDREKFAYARALRLDSGRMVFLKRTVARVFEEELTNPFLEMDGPNFRHTTMNAVLRDVIDRLSIEKYPPQSDIQDLEVLLWAAETATVESPSN